MNIQSPVARLRRRTARLPPAAALALLACSVVSSCAREGVPDASVPPLPEIPVEELGPRVRAQIEEAYLLAQSEPPSGDAAGRLGMLLQANLRLDEARLCFERAAALSPGTFRWTYYLAVVQAIAGRFGEAADSYRAALALDPGYGPAQLGLADNLLESGDPGQAMEAYRSILASNPESAPAQYGYGRALLALGEAERAVQALEEACRLFPEFGAAHYALALAYRESNQTEEAESHLELYRRHGAAAPPADDRLLAEVRELGGSFEAMRKGVEMTGAGRLEEAEEAFLEAAEDPAVALGAHSNLVIVYTRLGRFDDADDHYRKAASMNPDSEDMHFNYGVLLAMQDRSREAAAAFEAAIRINPLNAEAHMNLGYMAERNEDAEHAEASYRKALELQPGHAGASFRLGRLVLHRGDSGEAIDRFETSLATEGEHQLQSLYGLATAHAIAGNLETAIETGERALARARAEGNSQLAELIARDIETWGAHASR